MNKKSRIVGAFAAAMLVMTAMIGTTAASFQDKSDPVVNKFDLGNVETKIYEGEDGFKNPVIENVGENDCLVRARVVVSPEKAADNIVFVYPEDSKWTLNQQDGFYYYNEVLKADTKSQAIFKTIEIKEGVDWASLGIENFEVTVYEESVQTAVYDEGSKKMIDALNKNGDIVNAAAVWAVYEKETAE